jgi:hypothetical protein
MPADLVLKCSPGQFRNWCYAVLAMSTMTENVPPFKILLGHANVRDKDGREMHKSTSNTVANVCSFFLTEKLYASLVRIVDCGAPESAHLCDYPQPDKRVSHATS